MTSIRVSIKELILYINNDWLDKLNNNCSMVKYPSSLNKSNYYFTHCQFFTPVVTDGFSIEVWAAASFFLIPRTLLSIQHDFKSTVVLIDLILFLISRFASLFSWLLETVSKIETIIIIICILPLFDFWKKLSGKKSPWYYG